MKLPYRLSIVAAFGALAFVAGCTNHTTRAQSLPTITNSSVSPSATPRSTIPSQTVTSPAVSPSSHSAKPTPESSPSASPSTKPPAAAAPNLKVGSQGLTVAKLQSYLGGIPVDGNFGPKTQARVAQFQASLGLPQTGVVDAATWSAAINKGPGASTDGLGIDPRSIESATKSGWAVDASMETHMLYFLTYDSIRQKVIVAAQIPTSFGGCNRDGCFVTPKGAFKVCRKAGQKEVSHQWKDTNGQWAPMPWAVYMCYGDGGVAVHYDPLGNSHECVHVPEIWLAEYINKAISYSSLIVIH